MKSKRSTKELSPTNVKLGSDFEKRVCETFKNFGFFAHNCINGLLGQPCDIIALHGSVCILIDCKHIKKGTRFDFKNIQENQFNCFKLARVYNDINRTGFVIYCEEVNKVYFLPFSLVESTMDYKKVSIDCSQLPYFKDVINEWRNEYTRGEN